MNVSCSRTTTQWRRWGSNPRPLGLESSTLPLSHCVHWIIYVISFLFLLCFRARLLINALWSPAGKGLTSWLSFVMSNCEVVTFQLVSWVRCCARLYRFLIFALAFFYNKFIFSDLEKGLYLSLEKEKFLMHLLL